MGGADFRATELFLLVRLGYEPDWQRRLSPADDDRSGQY